MEDNTKKSKYGNFGTVIQKPIDKNKQRSQEEALKINSNIKKLKKIREIDKKEQ